MMAELVKNSRVSRSGLLFWALRNLLLATVVVTGLSYRFYLARFHTEVGLPNMAGWWVYITRNAARLAQGEDFVSTHYGPGQSWAAYLISQVFHLDPAVLRISFGLLDGIAIVCLYLLVSEMMNSGAGLLAALLYALWPEGASASINILHDHSPQPLFLFAGFWLLLLWLRKRRWPLLVLSGILLGLPPLFRADSAVVAPLATLGLGATLLLSRTVLRLAVPSLIVFLILALAPSLSYDLYLFSKRGDSTHVASGAAGGSVFIRYGRDSGLAGTRYADGEVAFVNGVGQPFGHGWFDMSRAGVIEQFGRLMFLADPKRYFELILSDSWTHLATPSGHLLWWSSELTGLEDMRVAFPLRNPEWPLAVLTAESRLQELLVSRVALIALASIGFAVGFWQCRAQTLLLGTVMVGWVAALLALVPNSRYLIMPFCLAFTLIPLPLVWILQEALKRSASAAKRLERRFSSRQRKMA